MGSILRATIKTKIALGFAIVLVALAGVAVKTTFALLDASALYQDYREVARVSSAIGEMRARMYGVRVAAESFVLSGDASHVERYDERLADADAALAQAREIAVKPELDAIIAGLGEKPAAYARAFEAARRETGETPAYRALLEAGRDAGQTIEEAGRRLDAKRDEIGPRIEATISSAATLAIWATAGAVLFGIVVAFLLGRSITGPLGAITAAMKRVSDGDLDTAIPGRERTDEIGAMSAALEVFRGALHRNREMEAQARDREALAQEEKRRAMRALADEFEAKVGGLARSVGAAATEM